MDGVYRLKQIGQQMCYSSSRATERFLVVVRMSFGTRRYFESSSSGLSRARLSIFMMN